MPLNSRLESDREEAKSYNVGHTYDLLSGDGSAIYHANNQRHYAQSLPTNLPAWSSHQYGTHMRHLTTYLQGYLAHKKTPPPRTLQ